MIVDDEPLIRNGLVKMIERVVPDWVIAVEANNGLEAIDAMAHERIDLIISDIKMPGMNGLQLMKSLSEGGHSVPFIVLTGYGEFHYAQEALRYSAFDYLLKPIHEGQLRHVLDRFMKDKYVPVGDNLDQLAQSQIDQLEFDLLNAFESVDKRKVTAILTEQCLSLSDQLPATMILNHVIGIINSYLTKKGVVGLDYLPKVSPEQMSLQLETIAQLTNQLLESIGSRVLPESDRIIERAQRFMKENIGRQLTLTMVADYVHFNPTYFSEYFRSKTGETFSHYLIRLRVEEAMIRLKHPGSRINEIAEQLGYQDSRYFSKMFKLMVGKTPKEYRSVFINEP